jgi:N-acetylmuramoyl-L-alanine amidase
LISPPSGARGVLRGAVARRLASAGLLLACAAFLPAQDPVASTAGAAGSSRSHPKPAVRLDGRDAAKAPGGEVTVPIDEGARAVAASGELLLDLSAPKGGVTEAWLSRYVPTAAARQAEKSAAGGSWPAGGQRLRLRYAHLDEGWRVRIVRALFPDAAPRGDAWVHRIGGGKVPAGAQTLQRIASWYTGSERNAPSLAQANPRVAGSPRAGEEIVVPKSLLLAGFARLLPQAVPDARADNGARPDGGARSDGAARPDGAAPNQGDAALASLASLDAPPDDAASGEPPEPEDEFTEAPSTTDEEGPAPPTAPGTGTTSPAPAPRRPPVAEGANELSYGRDAQGPYAAYRIKKGEALYSAVVVRFTGRVDVQEVNDLTVRVAERSGIRDVTSIPVGYRVRIPLDLLLTEYLPRDDPRRQEWERHQAEVERYTNPARTRNLEGVAVILDAGHGGRDRGAAHNGVWEHDYVYDVLCRVKSLLETRTRARVIPTIRDRRDGYKVQEVSRLRRNQSEVLLTDPPFPLSGTVPSVNLRWYLSNSWYRKLVREGTDPSKVVFTSFHADARHPSMAGAMVYVPGAEFRGGRYGSRREVYARYREAREEPYVAFTRAERERSEGLSRQFADDLIESFGAGSVRVHPYQPVRERIIRRGRAWVPAVLRCNAVPVEVLIEISNLSNPQDSRSLADPAYRQKVAEAYVEALGRYFDVAEPTTAARSAPQDAGGR